MKKIFFVLIFSTNLATAQNWFPLEIGNKWQMYYSLYTSWGGFYNYGIVNYEINKDTIINGTRYIYGPPYGLFRYDTVEQKLYLYASNPDSNYKYHEGVYMDFNLSNNDSLWQFRPVAVFYGHRWVRIFETNEIFLGRSWNVKGFKYLDYTYGENRKWAANFGYYEYNPIQAQFKLNDSLITYDPDHYPEISFTPINQISSDYFNANFTVKHYFTRWNSPGSPGSLNYIDSVVLFGRYEKGDSIYHAFPVSATLGYGNECTLNFLIDLELLKRQYTFKYKIQAKDKGLLPHYTTVPDTGYFSLVYVDSLTNVIEDNNLYNFSLFQNYPNPFNPSTKIRYTIPTTPTSLPLLGKEGIEGWLVTLKVYDVLGNEVATLVNEYKPSGSYEVEFDAKNLPSGIYFYQFKTNNYIETKKMILLR